MLGNGNYTCEIFNSDVCTIPGCWNTHQQRAVVFGPHVVDPLRVSFAKETPQLFAVDGHFRGNIKGTALLWDEHLSRNRKPLNSQTQSTLWESVVALLCLYSPSQAQQTVQMEFV